MRLILRCVFWVFIAFLFAVSSFVAAVAIKPDFILGNLIKFTAQSSYQLKVDFDSIDVNSSSIKISNVTLKSPTDIEFATSKTIDVTYDLLSILKSFEISLNASFSGFNFFLFPNETKHDMINLSMSYNSDFFSPKKIIKIISNQNSRHKFNCELQNMAAKTLSGKCMLKIGNSIFNADIEKKGKFLNGVLEIENIDILRYNFFREFLTQSPDVLSFLDSSIISGRVDHGSVKFHLNLERQQKITKENLSGNIRFSGINLKYDEKYPILSNISTDLQLSGSSLLFKVNSAFSGNTKINEGTILTDLDEKEPKITLKGTTNGGIKDLMDFIPKDSLIELKDAGINLILTKGTAITNINIIIPFAKDVPNTYNVRSTIRNIECKFSDMFLLQSKELTGLFDGKSIIISGNSTINDNVSYITFTHNLEDEHIENLMNIESKVTHLNLFDRLITIDKGEANIKLEYKNAPNSRGNIKITGDLTNSNFLINAIGINKKPLSPAQIFIQSKLEKGSPIFLTKYTNGDNSLDGTINIGNNTQNIDIKTDFKGSLNYIKIKKNPKSTFCDIKADRIDLSHENIPKLFSKFMQEKGSNLLQVKAEVKEIEINGGVVVDSVKVNLECEDTCRGGMFKANLGTKIVDLFLIEPDVWLIKTENAGALLHGLGLYDKIKAGTLSMRFDMRGLLGEFKLEKFVLVDSSFKTKIISIISFPGLLKGLTSNSIQFVKMIGKIQIHHDRVIFDDIEAEGPHFDFTMEGIVDLENRKVNLHGAAMPSLYGISAIIKKVPGVGKAFSGGHRKGLIFAPFRIKDDF